MAHVGVILINELHVLFALFVLCNLNSFVFGFGWMCRKAWHLKAFIICTFELHRVHRTLNTIQYILTNSSVPFVTLLGSDRRYFHTEYSMRAQFLAN